MVPRRVEIVLLPGDPMPKPRPVHYCGYPARRGEPTLCGLSREPDDSDTRAASRKSTVVGANVTCTDCLDILEGRQP